jgi:lipopolysaccharide/colanic/teichoic acid biosynthesis glycosyltransferase
MKRIFDLTLSLTGLLILSPVFLFFMILIWLQDYHSPLYIAPRVGKNGKAFKMVKLRSMIVNADKSGVDSTKSDDKRITWVGHFIRKFKLDELSQLWNVLCGHMSFVGPRPNVARDVKLYTEIERKLLNVKPGITDFSSIVFSDEGDILSGSSDPDLKYNQVIRPWKSRLGLLYIEKRTFFMDLYIIFLTVCAVFSKRTALYGVYNIVSKINGDSQLLKVILREEPLIPFPPPGADKVVENRKLSSDQ